MTPSLKLLKARLCLPYTVIARKTKNKRAVIVKALCEKGIKKQLEDAEVNHCLSFEQVSDELIEFYDIPCGDFDTVTGCKYSVRGYLDIGKLYSLIIIDCAERGRFVEEIMKVFSSFISDEISDFSSDLYYQNPSYIECSYKEGPLLG